MTQIPNAPANEDGTNPSRETLAQESESSPGVPHARAPVNSRSFNAGSSRRYRLPGDIPAYLYDLVANHVTIRIADGDLAPNTALPAEQRFAWEYGVSLGTVRHATELLRRRALLVTVRSKGTYISTTAPQAATEILERTKHEPAVRQAYLTQVIK
jgi:DNA-binding transcriptional regulator YhcF (GntR family)